MTKILIADDEKEIITLLRMYLEKEGLEVYEAYDGDAAYRITMAQDIDLAILDIMMPGMSGYELIKKIRLNSDMPILLLSAKVELTDRVLGLDLGADDYVTKPFEPLEIVARVKSRIRRMATDQITERPVDALSVGDLTLRTDECTLLRGGQTVPLTKAEFLILKLLMQRPGRVFTKEQIYLAAWGDDYIADDNTIRVIISRVRDKVGSDQITTIRGLGYRFEKEAQSDEVQR